ncbi:MAG: hypothetical protein RL328_1898 [Acidobacteriota bacterium]
MAGNRSQQRSRWVTDRKVTSIFQQLEEDSPESCYAHTVAGGAYNSLVRSWILRLHMVAGLSLSAYAVAIGLTGSALVFRDEIKAWDYPQFHRAPAVPISTTPDQALAAVRQAWPDGRVLSVTWPNQESPYWMSYVLRTKGGAREVFTDPATGRIVGDRDPSGGLNGWLLKLHTNLLAGSTGRRVNGYGAWLLVVMGLTGVVLWWPRQIWRPRLRAWPLHHATGVIALPFILVLAVTGTYFMWSADYVKLVAAVFPRTTEPRASGANGPMLPMEELARRSYAALPGRQIQRIAVVDQPTQAVRVTMREGTPAEFHLVSTVFLDPVTGAVLLSNPLDRRPAGDAILSWFSALHFGVFGGWLVRVLWFVLGLSLPVLSISGCLLWWRRVVLPARRRARADVAA